MNYPAVPKAFGTRYQQLKMPVTGCHSGLAGIFLIFSPHHFVLKKDSRQAGMTEQGKYYTPMQSIEEFFD
jgi:hypothetical protein